MNIIINGKKEITRDGVTINDLLSDRKLAIDHVVVEVNEVIVPRENFGAHRLKDHDIVEILRFVGGG